jgi:outer membrane protein OmpA-like peptidoglycan-associated protein
MRYNLGRSIALLLSIVWVLSSCTYNPMMDDNHLTGHPVGAVMGGAVGAGIAAAFGATKPVMGVAALAGAGLGYYFSTLRSSAAGIIEAHGQVYTLGDYVGIEIPTDYLFDTNTDEFLPNAQPVLSSIVSVLKRYPQNDVLISGNTSGFGLSRQELKLSEARARGVAAYLWMHGIVGSGKTRKLIYAGFGDFFPIANNQHFESIRSNSRIQITAFPPDSQLYWHKYEAPIYNYSCPSSACQTVVGCNVAAKHGGYKGEGWFDT